MDYLKSWFGRGRVRFTHPPESLKLTLADGRQTTLLELIESGTPPCQLNPLLFNGHAQTCWTSVKDAVDVPIFYKRRNFQADMPEYAGQFAVDFVVPPYDGLDNSLPPRTTYYSDDDFSRLGRREPEDGDEDPEATGAEALADDDDRPMLICLHGLTGGSYEPYMRAMLKPLVDAGWAACVVNSRGCAMSKITTGFLYNARTTWDCRQVVKWCRKTWPKRKLYGVGFSLGANMMANYVGEEGDRCMLEAAVVCSNPWTLEVGSMGLQRTFIGREIYSRTMGTNLKNVFEEHVDILKTNPRINADKIRKTKYLHDFDREMQAPCWGYPTEGAYYRDASSVDALYAMRIPFLAIHAEDDPIAINEAVPYEDFKHNPYTVLLTSSLGGHLSWFETGGGRWFAKPASNFLIKMYNDVKNVEKPDLSKPVRTKGVSVADIASTFSPIRHKVAMPGVD